jgi:hypothetical protein
MINIDNLFNLFPPQDNEDKQIVYIDFADKPVYKLGMYKKIILNHINFKKKVISFFKQTNAELSIEEMEAAGAYVAYNRAWFYIKDIDITNDDHLEAISTYCDEALETSLELGIQFYQMDEEYEKCAHLLKVLKKSQEFTL